MGEGDEVAVSKGLPANPLFESVAVPQTRHARQNALVTKLEDEDDAIREAGSRRCSALASSSSS